MINGKNLEKVIVEYMKVRNKHGQHLSNDDCLRILREEDPFQYVVVTAAAAGIEIRE